MEIQNLTAKDYKSDLKPIWCPGCGDYGVLNALYQALAKLQIPTHQLAVISGIGCSSRLPGYMKTYGFNSVHGRVLPVATGAKMANLDTTVIAVGGDGDGFSIGSGHIPHAARKNIDITYIVMNNSIYGLTKGQASPTSPLGLKTKTTAYGNMEAPINPVRMMISYNTSFVARAFSGYPKESAEILSHAIAHKGFSFVEFLSPCPTFMGRDQFTMIKEQSSFIDDSHDPSDEVAAFDIANSDDHLKLGIIYHKNRPTYTDLVHQIQDNAKGGKPVPPKMDLLKMFEP